MKEATTKPCKICNEIKPLSEYHKDKNYITGKKSTCKICVKIQKCSDYQRRKYNRADYSITNLPNSAVRLFEKLLFNVRMQQYD